MTTKQTNSPYLKVADVATLLSLIASMSAFLVILTWEIKIAGVLFIVAAILDGLDGRIARAMGQSSEFGMYLDSLVDVISFGMLPAAAAIVLIPSWPVFCTAVLFVSCGVYRLARFQVTHLKHEFQGMPITVNGVAVGVGLILTPVTWYTWIIPLYFILSSVLMVSTFRVKKL